MPVYPDNFLSWQGHTYYINARAHTLEYSNPANIWEGQLDAHGRWVFTPGEGQAIPEGIGAHAMDGNKFVFGVDTDAAYILEQYGEGDKFEDTTLVRKTAAERAAAREEALANSQAAKAARAAAAEAKAAEEAAAELRASRLAVINQQQPIMTATFERPPGYDATIVGDDLERALLLTRRTANTPAEVEIQTKAWDYVMKSRARNLGGKIHYYYKDNAGFLWENERGAYWYIDRVKATGQWGMHRAGSSTSRLFNEIDYLEDLGSHVQRIPPGSAIERYIESVELRTRALPNGGYDAYGNYHPSLPKLADLEADLDTARQAFRTADETAITKYNEKMGIEAAEQAQTAAQEAENAAMVAQEAEQRAAELAQAEDPFFLHESTSAERAREAREAIAAQAKADAEAAAEVARVQAEADAAKAAADKAARRAAIERRTAGVRRMQRWFRTHKEQAPRAYDPDAPSMDDFAIDDEVAAAADDESAQLLADLTELEEMEESTYMTGEMFGALEAAEARPLGYIAMNATVNGTRAASGASAAVSSYMTAEEAAASGLSRFMTGVRYVSGGARAAGYTAARVALRAGRVAGTVARALAMPLMIASIPLTVWDISNAISDTNESKTTFMNIMYGQSYVTARRMMQANYPAMYRLLIENGEQGAPANSFAGRMQAAIRRVSDHKFHNNIRGRDHHAVVPVNDADIRKAIEDEWANMRNGVGMEGWSIIERNQFTDKLDREIAKDATQEANLMAAEAALTMYRSHKADANVKTGVAARIDAALDSGAPPYAAGSALRFTPERFTGTRYDLIDINSSHYNNLYTGSRYMQDMHTAVANAWRGSGGAAATFRASESRYNQVLDEKAREATPGTAYSDMVDIAASGTGQQVAAAAGQAAEAVGGALSSAGSAITGAFSGLFGGSSSSSTEADRRMGEGDLGDPLTDGEKHEIHKHWDPEPDPGGMLPEPPEPEKKPPTEPGSVHFHPPNTDPTPDPTPTPTPTPPVTDPHKKPAPIPIDPIAKPVEAVPEPRRRVPPRTRPASTETPAFHISETRGWKFVHSVALPEHKTLPSFMREYRDYGHTTDLAPMQSAPMLEDRKGHGGGAMVHSDAAAVEQPPVPPPSQALPPAGTEDEPVVGYEREASTIEGMSAEDQDIADFTNEAYTAADERQPTLHGAKYIRNMSTMHNAVYERGGQVYVAERGTDPGSWDDLMTDGKIIIQDGAGEATKDISVQRQAQVLEQFDRVRRAYPSARITLGGHSLANNLISHVLLNRDDKNVRAVGFNGLPHRAFNETHHTDARYKHYHSRYDPVSYDPAANEKQTMPNNHMIPYFMKTGISPHSMTHFMRPSDRKRGEEFSNKFNAKHTASFEKREADWFSLLGEDGMWS